MLRKLSVKVPEPDCGVSGAAGQVSAIRTEADCKHSFCMARHGSCAAADRPYSEDGLWLVHNAEGCLNRHLRCTQVKLNFWAALNRKLLSF